MPTIDTLEALLKHELKDLYSAETQIVDALPKMIDAAFNKDLKQGLQQHLTVTKKQKQRLDDIQKLLGEEKAAPEKKGFFANLFSSDEGEEHCKAMEGLIKEGNSLLSEDMNPEVMDAAIIAAAQKIEHYEISSYGTARAFALQLQLSKVADLLQQTLNEEYEADDLLTELALSDVNLEAEMQGEDDDDNVLEQKQPAKKAAPEKPASKKAAPKKAVKKSAAPKKAKAAKSSNLKSAKSKSKR
jgi:ferritin-like metal-binding protein YciE